MNTALSPRQRRALRARAHALKPVVLVGSAGLSEPVLQELDSSLEHHELIKVRFHQGERAEIVGAVTALCRHLGAERIQQVGKTAVVYRQRAETRTPSRRRRAGPQT